MRRLTSGGAAMLTVLLSLFTCCVGAQVSAEEIIDESRCCENECAMTAFPAPPVATEPGKRSIEKPVIAVELPDAMQFASMEAGGAVPEVVLVSHLFEPLTTIQLRI